MVHNNPALSRRTISKDLNITIDQIQEEEKITQVWFRLKTSAQFLKIKRMKFRQPLPFHFRPGSIARALRTVARVANPQYAGSDCVW